VRGYERGKQEPGRPGVEQPQIPLQQLIRRPAATATTDATTLDAILSGEATVASAVSENALVLTGSPEAVQHLTALLAAPASEPPVERPAPAGGHAAPTRAGPRLDRAPGHPVHRTGAVGHDDLRGLRAH
jgi:hypothetical protein